MTLCSRYRFRSASDARRAAKYFKKKNRGVKLDVYYCPQCEAHHLSSTSFRLHPELRGVPHVGP